MSKQDLRKELIKRRLGLSSEFVSSASKKVVDKLLSEDLLNGLGKVLIYIPIGNEVDTGSFVYKLTRERRSLFLTAYDNKSWVISAYSPTQPLVKIFGEVMQPQELKLASAKKIDVAIMPGVAFSKNGARLGFGLGIYDKLLAGSNILKVGLCYDFQIVDDLIPESHDVRVDYIACESGIIKTT